MPKLLLLIAVVVLGLTGCGNGGSSDAQPSPSASASPTPTTITGVDVGGDFGSQPSVSVAAPVSVDKTQVQTLSKGDGAEVGKGDTVVVDYVGLIGRTGVQFDSSFDRGQPATLQVETVLPGIAKALEGQTVGSRVVAAVAPSDGFPQGQPSAGIAKDDTLILVLDIQARLQFKPTGLDGVALAEGPGSQPTLQVTTPFSVPKTTVETLTKGNGPTVQSGDSVTVDYVGVNGRTGQVFDSSYANGSPATFATDQVVKGFATALEGTPVGSRIVVAIPPEDGYGKAGNPQIGILGTDTLVFVIDVRDTAAAPASSGTPPASTPASSPPTSGG